MAQLKRLSSLTERQSTGVSPRAYRSLLQHRHARASTTVSGALIRGVLIGDNGEHDPEIYAALMHAYPSQIKRIYLRNVTGALRGEAHVQATFAGIAPDRWQLFTVLERLALPE
jgi:phosphatidate phosphatase APP1